MTAPSAERVAQRHLEGKKGIRIRQSTTATLTIYDFEYEGKMGGNRQWKISWEIQFAILGHRYRVGISRHMGGMQISESSHGEGGLFFGGQHGDRTFETLRAFIAETGMKVHDLLVSMSPE
jgi:hypothetical protein